MSDRFTQLQSVVTAEELQELTIRRAAVDRLRGMYEKSPLDKVEREWTAAKKGLEAQIDELWQKYNATAAEPCFETVTAVWQHLVAAGYDVGKSTVYRDAKNGTLKRDEQGRVSEVAVKAYILDAGLRKNDDAPDAGQETRRKLRLEIETMELKLERQQFEFDRDKGKYVPRDDLMLEIISRVQVFEAQFDHFAMTRAPELVALCNGDSAQAPAVQAFLRAEKARLITAMADTERFQVVMIADEVGVGEETVTGDE